jgi:hypothetical protein
VGANHALIVAGVGLELIGITLLALDVLADPAGETWRRVARWVRSLRLRVRTAAGRMRDWLVWHILRRREVRETVTSGGAMSGGISPTGLVHARRIPGPTVRDDLVLWLRETMVETLDRLDALERASVRDRDAAHREVTDLEARLRMELGEAIDTSEGAFRSWRVLGFALAIAGVTVTLVGSLL